LIRRDLDKLLEKAHYQTVEIERKGDRINVVIFTSKPGMIIKHKGEGLDDIKKALEKSLNKFRRKNKISDKYSISINIEEVRKPFLSAQIVAFDIRDDIERRLPYRRTIKKYLERIMSNREVKGAKIYVTGRLDGADIARSD
jgi:small subunit ribosomal protein S3